MRIGCLDDIVKAVNESGSPSTAQLVGTQTGDFIVPMFNWSEYFEDKTIITALKGISRIHHFHFKCSAPGTVLVKDTTDDKEWKSISLVKSSSWQPSPNDLPHPIVPASLSLERQYYLFDKKREFVPAEFQDLVCPEPTQPRP